MKSHHYFQIFPGLWVDGGGGWGGATTVSLVRRLCNHWSLSVCMLAGLQKKLLNRFTTNFYRKVLGRNRNSFGGVVCTLWLLLLSMQRCQMTLIISRTSVSQTWVQKETNERVTVWGNEKSQPGFHIPFNSQGHIGTGPQHCHLWESNPHRGDSLWLDAKLANLLGYWGTWENQSPKHFPAEFLWQKVFQ